MYFIILLVLFTLLLTGIPRIAFGATNPPTVFVDGNQVKATTKMTNNRTLISLREYFESLGAVVIWQQKDNSVLISKGTKKIELKIGDKIAYTDGKKITLDQASYEVNGRTYVPVRFVAEALNSTVLWNQKLNKVLITTPKIVTDNYDVIVIGTDPEGIIAAIAAAREGQQTLLLDTRSKLGGLFTIGELNTLDMSYSPTNTLLTQGLFSEFFQLINRRSSFDTLQAEKVFNDMIARENNITLVKSVKNIKPIVSNNKITSVTYTDSKGKQQTKKGKQFIDSTQNGDFAFDSGVSFTYGQQDYRGLDYAMCVTLVFEISGLNWNEIRTVLKEDTNSGTGTDNYSAWGFPEMYDYPSKQENVKIRGLNIGRLDNGNYLVNALQILDVNGLNQSELDQARKDAEKELPDIIQFMKTNLDGFKSVKLVRTADELYIRETRHMLGQYRLSVDDVLENRDFPDKIGFGSYPIDVQAAPGQPDFIVGNPAQYSIPFRSIVPKEINNLLVASKSSSYESLAHGSARVVPVGMVIGEAAGVSAAYANKKNINFITMATQKDFSHVKAVQKILNQKGANLTPIPAYDNPITKHWAYDGIKFLRKYAIVGGGYKNNYETDTITTNSAFNTILKDANERSKKQKSIKFLSSNEATDLTKTSLITFMQENGTTLNDFSPLLQEKINQTNFITNDISYMFIYEYLHL